MEDVSDSGASAPAAAPREPWWVRVTTAPRWTRILPIGLMSVAYLVLYHSVANGPDRFALRPLNLVVMLVAGVLLGLRGALVLGALLSVVNVGLYLRDGLFGATPGQMAGNIISVIAGVSAGAILGKARDLALALRAEVRRRQEVERQKEELTALLVHDFKNPLAAILGHSALLIQESMGPEDVRDSSESILQSAERLKRMVLDLLDINRAENGELRPQLREVDLNQLAQEVRDAMARQLQDRRQRVELQLARQDGVVRADSELVRRLLINLMDNASKYMPAERTIRIEVAPQEDAVVLGVADEGPGIPKGWEHRIFDKYVRLDQTSGTAAGSSRGLGLAFCRLAAEVHGGRIWVEPGTPSGSVFRVRLPRHGPRLPAEARRG